MPRLELVEASLRHGQQVLLLSRLRQRHAVRAAELLDGCGFAALEVFGGATFEAQLRFLGEDPFERLREIRKAAPSTPLLASLAGQMLVGHRHAPDDVVEEFIRLSARAGVDIFRLHDPLNDVTNLEKPIAAVKAAGRRAEGVVVYTDSPTEALVELATRLAELGCDSICLHDPLGLLGHARADEMITVLSRTAGLPVAASFCSQTGQADFAYHGASHAEVARVDVCVSPLSGGATFPAAEAVIAGLAGTKHATEMNLEAVMRVTRYLEEIAPLYGELVDPALWRYDGAALRGLLPVSAMGHGLAELRQRDALDRLPEVEAEIFRVRDELGHPPLVSPIPEIVATQAVYNVFDGDRYASISQEVKDYCLGLFGTPPGPINPDVRRLVNGREEPITCRPADLLEPGLPAARRELEREEIRTDEEAVVAHALFGADFVAFAQGEASVELLGDEPETEASPAPAEGEADDSGNGTAGAAEEEAADPPEEVRELRVEVDGQAYQVRVFGAGAGGSGGGGGGGGVAAPAAPATVREGTVVAPMQGLILKLPVKQGQKVAIGDVVAILEAMKMQNDVTASRAGTVTAVHVKEGDVVGPKDAILDIG